MTAPGRDSAQEMVQPGLAALEIGSASLPLRFVRNRRSRRYILRLLPDGIARVTVPRGGSLEFAAEFAKRNRAWIEKQLAKTPPAWAGGTTILFRGMPSEIQVIQEERCRRISVGNMEFRVPLEGELRGCIEAQLRQMAANEFPTRTRELALAHGIHIESVQVRNQRSRWGSCSRSGRISLNWRLIQTPEFVRDYIIVHELMHRREMNHSDRFWTHVQRAFPDYIEAERWLRKHAALVR